MTGTYKTMYTRRQFFSKSFKHQSYAFFSPTKIVYMYHQKKFQTKSERIHYLFKNM